MSDDQIVVVRILDVPVELHRRAAEHFDGLRREFALIAAADPVANAPAHLQALVEDLGPPFGAVIERPDEAAAAAAARGEVTFDVTFELSSRAADPARRFDELLDEADAYCATGEHLLTLVAPDDVRAYRKWFVQELVRQIEGSPPTPFDPVITPAVRVPGAGGGTDGATDAPVVPDLALPDGWRLEHDGPTTTLALAGELDLASSGDLRTVVTQLQAGGTGDLTIDLTAVSFIDSVGISVLAFAQTRLRENGAELSLTIPPPLRTLFEVTGFTTDGQAPPPP